MRDIVVVKEESFMLDANNRLKNAVFYFWIAVTCVMWACVTLRIEKDKKNMQKMIQIIRIFPFLSHGALEAAIAS